MENSEQKTSSCSECNVNKTQLFRTNARCRQLEQINRNLKLQIEYLLGKVQHLQSQDTTSARSEENTAIEEKIENPTDQSKPTAHQSPSKDEVAPNLNTDGIY